MSIFYFFFLNMNFINTIFLNGLKDLEEEYKDTITSNDANKKALLGAHTHNE